MPRGKKRSASGDKEQVGSTATKRTKQAKATPTKKTKQTKVASPTRKAKQAKVAAPTKKTKQVKVAPKKTKTESTSHKKADKVSSPSTAAPSGKTFHLESVLTDGSWRAKIADQFGQDYFKDIETSLRADYVKNNEVFPPRELIFNAFNLTPFNKVKVVILGQDPYHDVDQAHGLSFSVCRGVKIPPSLKNIYKEMQTDVPGFTGPDHGCLEKWAKQGVLLLNATLTVQAHKPNSHSKYGWQAFTDQVIRVLSQESSGLVFILWGGFAQKKAKLIDSSRHTVINAAHPSPLSVSKFMGCKCFSQTATALKKHGKQPVDWTLD